MPAKTIKCPYCAHTFMVYNDQPKTYCPKCKNSITTSLPKKTLSQKLASTYAKIPNSIKYVISAALIAVMVYLVLNTFGIV